MTNSRLDRLLPDVTSMSNEELTDLVREIRKDRGTSKASTKPKVKRTSAKKRETLKELLSQMTPEQVKELLSK